MSSKTFQLCNFDKNRKIYSESLSMLSFWTLYIFDYTDQFMTVVISLIKIILISTKRFHKQNHLDTHNKSKHVKDPIL